MKNKKENLLQITQIKIKLPNKDIELSSGEARQVYEELKKLFELEKSEIEKFKEEWEKLNPPQPYPVYPYHPPIIIERWPERPWWDYQPIWLVDYEQLPKYDGTTTVPLDLGHTTCLSINLTNSNRTS